MASRKLFVLAVALALLLAPWDPGRANTIGIYPPGSISTAVQFYTNPGDTVLVYPGVYINESGALVDHAVTVIGVGGAANNEVRICTDLCQAILFNINMPSGTVLIDGLTMTRDRQWPGDAYGLHVYGSGSVTVRNCVFRELYQDGIVSGGPAYLRVEGCLFLRTQGVTLYTSNAELAGNTFSESGIYLTNSASPLIRRNIFFRCSDNLICDFPSAPILECNDTWASLWRRCDPGVENGNFGADPLFCDWQADDYRLQSQSPCLPANSPPGCGQIGAFPACESSSAQPVAGSPAAGPLRVNPNPVTSAAEFTFAHQEGVVTLELFDAQGRIVDVLRGDKSPIEWSVPLTLPRGTYFARLNAGVRGEIVKVVLQ